MTGSGSSFTSSLQPPDAVVALRGYPRRFRAAVAGWDDDEDPDAVVRRRPAGGGSSALEHVVAAAQAFASAERRLRQVTVSDRPSLETPPDGADVSATDLDRAIAELAAAAESLAAAISEVSSSDWSRVGVDAGGAERSALDLVREAVAAGHDHLRGVSAAITAVRGRPLPSTGESD